MKNLIILSLFILHALFPLCAQETPIVTPSDSLKLPSDRPGISRNFIKLNLTSLLIKNYAIQYERVLSKRISLGLVFRIMPESNIPYINNIFRWIDEADPETQDIITNLTTGNHAITPEIKWYTGKKGYGTGFYISFFYRYEQYKFNNADISYEADNEEEIMLSTSGNVSCHSGGFMLGTQWALSKNICLDWWILGPHIGISSADVTSLPSRTLSLEEQQEVEDKLNDIDIPMFKHTVDVTADKASMNFNGLGGGIRAGLSLGIKF